MKTPIVAPAGLGRLYQNRVAFLGAFTARPFMRMIDPVGLHFSGSFDNAMSVNQDGLHLHATHELALCFDRAPLECTFPSAMFKDPATAHRAALT